MLCVKILNTLYLTDRLWWLSQCKYWSVWVGFLYTVVDKFLSYSGVTWVSRKGIDPSGLVSSVINWIWRSMELMFSRKWFLCSSFLDDKGYHPHTLPRVFGWVGDMLIAWLQSLQEKVVHNWAYGWLPAHVHNTYLEQEIGVLEAEFQQDSDVWYGHGCPIRGFCILFQFVLMIFMVGCTDTDVNNALTSYEVVHSPSSGLIFLTCSTKFMMFLML